MAWNDPRTWFAGEYVTSDFFNAQIRDNLNVLSVAYDTATGKISALNSSTLVSFSTLARLVNCNVTPGSNVGTSATDLISSTVPANTLTANGTYLRITYWGTTTNSANAKIVRGTWNGTNYAGYSGMLANSVAHRWHMETILQRWAASGVANTAAFSNFLSGASGAAAVNASEWTTGMNSTDWTAGVIAKITGQGGASSEITALGQVIEAIQ